VVGVTGEKMALPLVDLGVEGALAEVGRTGEEGARLEVRRALEGDLGALRTLEEDIVGWGAKAPGVEGRGVTANDLSVGRGSATRT
jgi:hypothetical protein